MKKSRASGPQIPPDYHSSDAFAIQQVMAGVADSFQQQRAMKWIIEKASGMYEFQYYATDRDTSFALGRGFVGMQIVKLSKLNTSTLRSEENNED